MADCCNDKACEIEALKDKQTATLKVVLAINAVMFGVEISAGIAAGSVSLVADSLDMLGDALVYGFSMCSPSANCVWQALQFSSSPSHCFRVSTASFFFAAAYSKAPVSRTFWE